MKQTWFSNVIILSGGGYYNPVSSITDMSAFETAHRCPVRAPGVIRNFLITLKDALLTTQTRTFTVRKNGVNTALTITLSGAGTTEGSDLTHAVTVAAGDELSVVQSTFFSPASTQAYCRLEFEADADDTTVYGSGGGTNQLDAPTRYRPILSGCADISTTGEALNASFASVDGTLTDLDVRLSVAPTGVKSRTFTIIKNTVAQDGTGGTPNTVIVVTGSATTGTANFSLPVVAGDRLSLQCVSSGSPANSYLTTSVVFVSTDANAQHVTLTDDAALSTSATQYNTPHGANITWTGTSTRSQMGGSEPIALQHIHALVSVAPGVGKSWTFTLQKNDVDTALVTAITGTATENAYAGDDIVVIGEGDTFRIKVVPSGTPASNSFAKVTFFPFTPNPILGSAVFGAYTTVVAPLAIAMGLDGDPHTDNDPNTLTVYGDLHVTGDTVIDGSSSVGSGASVADGDYGDITVSASGATWTIDSGAVSYAKIQDVSAASTLLGRGSAGGAGDVEEITIGTGLTMSGTTLSASGTMPGSVVYVRKTADESVTSSNAQQDDNHLFFSVGASEVWFVQLWLLIDGAQASDLQVAIVGPTGSAGWQGGPRLTDSASSSANTASNWSATTTMDGTATRFIGAVGAGTVVCSNYQGFVRVGGSSGTVKLQWSQEVSGGTATKLLTDSLLIATRLA